MSLAQTLSGPIEYLPFAVILSRNLDNNNLAPRGAMNRAISPQRLDF